MMTGVVTASREAIVRLQLRGSQGQEAEIDAVLDTGFTEALSLPQAWVDSLALLLVELNEMTLADGSVIQAEVYDHLLTMQVVAGGSVTIAALV